LLNDNLMDRLTWLVDEALYIARVQGPKDDLYSILETIKDIVAIEKEALKENDD